MLTYLTYAQRCPDQAFFNHAMSCILPNQSSIIITYDERHKAPSGYRYTFRWEEADRSPEARSLLRASGRAEAPEPCQAALSWPHIDYIQLRILERATEEARK